VADAIEFCDKDLGLQQFANSEATCEYVRICNTAFDLLDSKVPFTKNTKMPLRKNNKPVWTAHFNAIEHFFAVCYTQTLQQQLKQSSLWQKNEERSKSSVWAQKKRFSWFSSQHSFVPGHFQNLC
jgi:hypothetical protein